MKVNHTPVMKSNIANMFLNGIRGNKVIVKIFEFTVYDNGNVTIKDARDAPFEACEQQR